MKNVATGCGVLIIAVILMGYIIVSIAFVQVYLWDWFIIPLDLDLPRITMSQWIGINMFLSTIKVKLDPNNKAENEAQTQHIINIIIFPWVLLFLGWIITLFI